MIRKSLFAKFVVIFIPLLMATAGAVGLGQGIISRQAYLEMFRADYSLVALQSCRRIEGFLSQAKSEVDAMAAMISALGLNGSRNGVALSVFHRYFNRFQHIALVNPQGRPLFATAAGLDNEMDPNTPVLFRQTTRIGRRAESSMISGELGPVMYLTSPVRREGQLAAMVWARLSLKPVWDVVIGLKRDLNFGQAGHIYLMDQDGVLVASDRADRPYEPARDSGSNLVTTLLTTENPTRGRLEKSLDADSPRILKSSLRDGGEAPVFRIGPVEGVESLIIAAPVRESNWTLYLVQPYGDAFQYLSKSIWTSVALILVAVLVGSILTWVMASRVLQPMTRLHEAVARAAMGDFSRPIVLTTRDEVGELARHFNEMLLALHEHTQRLVAVTTDLNHAKCLALVGTTAAKVNHQVGNFLNNLVLALSILRADHLSDISRESLNRLEAQTRQIHLFIERLIRFSQRADLSLTNWEPDVEMAGLADLIRPQAESRGIELILDLASTPSVLADPPLMREAMLNLLQNALEAESPGGRVVIRVCEEVGWARIEVEDHGPGIPTEDMDRVFRPFFTKKKEQGTGLGLALVQTVITAHGGQIVLSSQVGRGTTATCRLPFAPAAGQNFRAGVPTMSLEYLPE